VGESFSNFQAQNPALPVPGSADLSKMNLASPARAAEARVDEG
jgi:hypothetical protein